MANIVSVREFVQEYRNYKPGTEIIVVNAARRKILASVSINEKPEAVERSIKQIFSR